MDSRVGKYGWDNFIILSEDVWMKKIVVVICLLLNVSVKCSYQKINSLLLASLISLLRLSDFC